MSLFEIRVCSLSEQSQSTRVAIASHKFETCFFDHAAKSCLRWDSNYALNHGLIQFFVGCSKLFQDWNGIKTTKVSYCLKNDE